MPKNKEESRQNELDWLRVMAFGLLIPFHAFIGFLPVGEIIYPYVNDQLLGKAAGFPMTLIHQWRLPLLFIISGMGIYFAVNKSTWKEFIKERTKRLLIPLITIIIIASIISGTVLKHNQINLFNYFGHLWFIISLWVYSMICIPLFFIIKKRSDGKISNIIRRVIMIKKGIGILFIMPIPIVIIELLIKPSNRRWI